MPSSLTENPDISAIATALAERMPDTVASSATVHPPTRSYAAVVCGNGSALFREEEDDGTLVPFVGPARPGEPPLAWLSFTPGMADRIGGVVRDDWILRKAAFGAPLLRFVDGPLLHVRLCRDGSEVRAVLRPRIRIATIPESAIAEAIHSRHLSARAFATLLAVHAMRYGAAAARSLLAAVATVPTH